MSNIPKNLRYTKDHEWVKQLEDDFFLVGITDHAQESLGDVTFVEFPEVGECFETNQVFGVVESVKAASDLYMPISGEILECNTGLDDSPELVNQDPYLQGWMIKIKASDSDQFQNLLSFEAYESEIG